MAKKTTALVTSGVLFVLGALIVLLSPPRIPFLVVATIGGSCLFGSIALVCTVERKLKEEFADPLIEGSSIAASEAYHTAIYNGDSNPGAIAMIEKGEEMVNEGERMIRDGNYHEGLQKVQDGEKRINLGERLRGRRR